MLRVHDLKKRFGASVALSGVDLGVRAGDIYGFLGRNGAGKSTTIKIVAGLVRADEGRVEYFGTPLSQPRDDVLSRIGFLIENPAFHPGLNAIENLYCHQILRGLPKRKAMEEIEFNIDRVGLMNAAHRKVGGYSTGMRQRLGLAQAFLGDPELIVLDEPLNGLDPEGIYQMRKLILDVAAEQGTTFFVSSHILVEVEQMCSRLGIVSKGRVVAEGTLDELGATGRVLLRVNRPDEALKVIEKQWPDSDARSIEENRISIRMKEDKLPELVRHLVEQEFDLFEVTPKPRSLEEIFMSLTRDSKETTLGHKSEGNDNDAQTASNDSPPSTTSGGAS